MYRKNLIFFSYGPFERRICFSSLKVHIRQLSSRFSFFLPPSYFLTPQCYMSPYKTLNLEIPINVFLIFFLNLVGNRPLSPRYDKILIHGPKSMPTMHKWQHPEVRSDKVDVQVPLWCSFSCWATGTRTPSSFWGLDSWGEQAPAVPLLGCCQSSGDSSPAADSGNNHGHATIFPCP